MNMHKTFKLFFAAAAVIFTVLLTGCGARLDTFMTMDTSFYGKRVITAELSKDDVAQYVKGGVSALDRTITDSLPDELTLKMSENDSEYIYTFTLNFNGLDDYRSKVRNIIALSEPDFEAVITFDNSDTIFKHGFSFEENFTSEKLLGWAANAVENAGICSSSGSIFFEIGNNTISFCGTEYSSSAALSVYESKSYPANEIDVATYILPNGNFERTIDIGFYSDTIENIAANGMSADDFFEEKAADAEYERKEENNKVIYSFKASDMSAEETEIFTDRILCSENASFLLTFNHNETLGTKMNIIVSDLCDGSFYFDSRTGTLRSSIYLFEDTVLKDGDFRLSDDSSCFYYERLKTAAAFAVTGVFEWEAAFDKVSAELGFSGKKAALKLVFSVPEGIPSNAAEIIKAALAEASPDGVKLSAGKRDGVTVYTADFGKASYEKAADLYKNFVYNYTGEKVNCSFGSEKLLTGSPFRTLRSYTAEMDMSPLSHKDIILVFDEKASELTVLNNSNVSAENNSSDGKFNGTFSGKLEFYVLETGTNLIGIIFVVIGIIALIMFALVIAANAKSIAAFSKKMISSAKGILPEKNTADETDAETQDIPETDKTDADKKGEDVK
ncbi:MAG: hypothetical protein ACI4I1_09125 [Oscillospiraceae bacterium]